MALDICVVAFAFQCFAGASFEGYQRKLPIKNLATFLESPNELYFHSYLVGYHFLWNREGPKYTGDHNILDRKMGGGGYRIFKDQNLGSHKMTTDSVLILFKKNTILACLGGKVYQWWGL